MDKKVFLGKTKQEAINNAIIELQETEENLLIRELETKTGLFKTKKVEIEVVTKDEVINFIKEYVQKLVHNMGINTNMELKKHDENITVTLYSNNNALLIGKQGRTMESLAIIVKQAIYTKFGFYFNFTLDVGEYKIKQEINLEHLAHNIAREVITSKIEAKLDPMNSYERRIIHNALTNNKYVYTESYGEEPNRCVIIKPKENN